MIVSIIFDALVRWLTVIVRGCANAIDLAKLLFAYLSKQDLKGETVIIRALSAQEKQRLSQASIDFSELNEKEDDDRVAVSLIGLYRIKRRLKAQILGVFEPNDCNGRKEAVIIIPHESGQNAYRYQFEENLRRHIGSYLRKRKQHKISQTIADILKRHVYVAFYDRNEAGGLRERDTYSSGFSVYLNCRPVYDPEKNAENSPESTDLHEHTKWLFNAPLPPHRIKLLKSHETGLPIIDPDSNIVVAELLGNSLYVLVDVTNRDKRTCFVLLSRILRAAEREMRFEENLERAVEKLKLKNQIAGVDTSEFTISCYGLPDRTSAIFSCLARQILMPLVRSDIGIAEGRGANTRAYHDNHFRIFVQGAPGNTISIPPLKTLFGHRLTKTQASLAPSPAGVPLYDDEGKVFGEISGRNLYFHSRLIHWGSIEEIELACKIFLSARRAIACGAMDAGADEVLSGVAHWFARDCLGQVQVAREKAPIETDIQSLRNTLQSVLSQTAKVEKLVLKGDSEVGEEFDRISQLHKVKCVRVEGNKIVVSTETLYCVNPITRVTHEIGEFDIEFDLNKKSVRWLNQTRKVHGGNLNMNAPHVNAEGIACLGNTKDLFPKLIESQDITSAVQLAIAFIESVNVDDNWGRHIACWPAIAPRKT